MNAHKRDWFLPALILLSLLVGAFTLRSYGESWDDHSLRKYANYSLRTYSTWRTQGQMPITTKDLGNYGPAYVMTVALLTRALSILPIPAYDLRHLLYFLTHLLGVWAFYQLGKRWLSLRAARYATLLYVTQPLFWGHAFMNPKDTPFLAFFMLSLHFGLQMIDQLGESGFPRQTAPTQTRLMLTGGIIALAFFYLAPNLIRAIIESLVRAAAAGETNLVSLLASDIHSAAPEVYVQRYFTFFLWGRSLLFLLFLIPNFLIPNRLLPHILLPALLLGYTTSIRILAPFAGMLVALYALRKDGKRALPALMFYALIALAGMYISWPYLWSDPIAHFIESAQTMSKYPWYGKVLFNGAEYSADALPYSYLPVLLAAQFTEPTWILFFIGAVAAWKEHRAALAFSAVWFAAPLLGFILFHAKLYDNFRQIFFILPPVFLLAGLGAENLLARLKLPALRIGAAALLLLPGVLACVELHPYQYVYYNSFVPNPSGKFELDYWAISYREAMNDVNRVAPPNANVMVAGPGQVAELYAREDVTVLSDDEPNSAAFTYAVILARYGWDKTLYPEGEIVFTVERRGLRLAVVKRMGAK
ncbi:MAG: glycosyltransferase family 39 protein [Anaerolineales bacterium]